MLFIEYDVDDIAHIGDVDLAIVIHISINGARAHENAIDDVVHVSDIDLTIAIDITLDHLRPKDVRIMAIERFHVHDMVACLTVLVDRELDALDGYGIGAHIACTTQDIEVEQDGVIHTRFEGRSTILGIELEVVGRGVEAVTRINLHIIDRNRGVEGNAYSVRQTI